MFRTELRALPSPALGEAPRAFVGFAGSYHRRSASELGANRVLKTERPLVDRALPIGAHRALRKGRELACQPLRRRQRVARLDQAFDEANAQRFEIGRASCRERV